VCYLLPIILDLTPSAPRRINPPEIAKRLNQGELVLGNFPPATVVGVGVGATLITGVGVGVGVMVAVGVGVGVGVGVTVAVGVGVGVATTQASLVITLALRLTAPVCANNCPRMAAPDSAEIDVKAKIRPTKVELVPSVAELPTLQ